MRWLLLTLVAAGCGQTRPCASGSLLLSLQLADGSAAADTLALTVLVDGTQGAPHSVTRKSGRPQESVEIVFPNGYRAGSLVEVAITASVSGTIVGQGALSLRLAPGCSTAGMVVGAGADGGADLAITLPDLATNDLEPSEDLSVPLDLSPSPDLGRDDLSRSDMACTPRVFHGSFDGSLPVDCNTCGCDVDPLDNPAQVAEEFAHATQGSGGWNDNFDGGLTLAGTALSANAGESYSSTGRLYLAGDFDALVDYRVSIPFTYSFLQFMLIGPQPHDGGIASVLPFGEAVVYQGQASSTMNEELFADDRELVMVGAPLTGTMRIRRTNGTLCASLIGGTELCHAGTLPDSVYIILNALVANPSCTSSCTYQAQLSHLRLLHGILRPSP